MTRRILKSLRQPIQAQASQLILLLLCTLGLVLCAGVTRAADLNGYYEAPGGAYFIRQIGSKIYWLGEDPDGSYANVLAGTISGNKITARWWDLPKGKTKGAGEMTLEIQGAGATLVQLSSTTPFGDKTFKKAVPSTSIVGGVPVVKGFPPEMRSRPEGFSGGASNLTGAWTGDDLATYYIRETPAGDVVWLAENNSWGGPGGYAQPSFAHVFIGKRISGLITGEWADLPKGKAKNNGVLSFKVVNRQELTANNAPVGIEVTKLWRSLPDSLRGYADLHTHPMVNLGFGGKLIHGGPDVGSLLPADADCNHNVPAKSIAQALGKDNSTHGGSDILGPLGSNPCGDNFRQLIIDAFQYAKHAAYTPDNALGYPGFKDYPLWNDISHQKMWIDWVRRSYDGGQRVMVALATHNATLAAAVSGPGDGPTDDAGSADKQVKEIKALVKRHSDFMEVALTADDLRRIVAANKMAIVLGVEIDNIGNFNKPSFPPQPLTEARISAEIKRLHKDGVRYLFPVHVLDNAFGHTAVYEDLFNYSNKRESGKWWDLVCATDDDQINYRFEPLLSDQPKELKNFLGNLASDLKLSLDLNAPTPPSKNKCGGTNGHKNSKGLTTQGHTAIKEMMKLGMLVDIDHMSQKAADETLALAEGIPGGGFPVVSGHNGLRGGTYSNENLRTPEQLRRIGQLGGMFGLGSDAVQAADYLAQYLRANESITNPRGNKRVGAGHVSFGTDLNGLVKGPMPAVTFSQDAKNLPNNVKLLKDCSDRIYNSAFTTSKTGDKTWNYCSAGVAHYGMLPDFLRDMYAMPQGDTLQTNIMQNAEAFAQMWEKAEKNRPQ